jgi:hypothetical protein
MFSPGLQGVYLCTIYLMHSAIAGEKILNWPGLSIELVYFVDLQDATVFVHIVTVWLCLLK